jgi:hypothetical protein
MTELQPKPCDFDRHRQAATCDCGICGWHVWDMESTHDASGELLFDGTKCPDNRPRADRYGG